MTDKKWRRFVRAQRSRETARWLRWTQTCREIEAHYTTAAPIGVVRPGDIEFG